MTTVTPIQKTADEDSVAVSSQGFPVLITETPIDARHRAVAFGIVIPLAIGVATVGPFATGALPRVDVFIPVLQTAMCIVDLIMAILFFGQYLIQPKHPLLAVAGGYVFTGVFAFLQTFAFPGAYSPTALIGDGVNSPAWLYVLWHTSFALSVIVYALSKDADEAAVKLRMKSNRGIVGMTVACILGAAIGLTWMATAGAEHLPTLYMGATVQTSFAAGLYRFLLFFSFAAFLLLLIRRRTILDLWLMVALVVWWPNFLLPALVPVVWFTLGWYVARGFALLASSTLLIGLLVESTTVHARLANALFFLRRERADRFMSIEAATSAMAHEVRQPLTAIELNGATALTLLRRMSRAPELENVRKCLNCVLADGYRVEGVIKSISELFKSTRDQRAMLQFNDVVREALDLAQDDLHAGGVSVATEYADNLAQVSVDHTQIQQVVLNLIKNAIDAMQCVPRGKRHLQVSTSFDGKSLVSLCVQDSGPGIAVEARDSIFQPFFTTKSAGTGLGLSICRFILERHGGALCLVKTDSGGSSFEATLPISTSESRP
jgi:signal transduction histidine kinase